MRFAYIDSNGNEVPIPSVDALALRIELGAITEDTQLYDAQADQWGPAHSHEIYHTLSRVSGADDGFMPAPPVAAPAPAVPDDAVSAEVEAAKEPAVAAEPEEAEAAAEPEITLAEPEEAEAPPAAVEDAAPEVAGAGGGDDDLGFGDIELAPAGEPLQAEVDDAPLDLVSPDSDTLSRVEDGEEIVTPGGFADEGTEEGGAFDFGDMDGGLEVETTFEASDDAAAEPAMDFSGGMDLGAEAKPAPDFSGGMELETPMEFSAGGFDAGAGGALDLEAPMSEFSPEDPPAWMEEEAAADDPDVMDLSSVTAGVDQIADGDEGEKRVPKNKPSPPKLRKQRNLALPIIGVVVVLAIGVGGYAAWPIISERLANDGPEVPAVTLPEIPAELVPQMESAAQAAIASAYGAAHAGWAANGPVGGPGDDWLAGVYLANASRLANVENFWNGMSDLVDRVDGVDLAAFDAAVQSELEAQGASAANAALIRARADSGYVAAEAARDELSEQMGALIDAALRLHSFLINNEANIEYVPASTATTDPVLEANPATPELRSAMEGLIDEVTSALFDLEYRDQITADGLWQAYLARLQAVGVQ